MRVAMPTATDQVWIHQAPKNATRNPGSLLYGVVDDRGTLAWISRNAQRRLKYTRLRGRMCERKGRPGVSGPLNRAGHISRIRMCKAIESENPTLCSSLPYPSLGQSLRQTALLTLNCVARYINLCNGMLEMVYADFLDALGQAGLSVRAFAELVGMNPNSISNYARNGELPTHLALIAVLVAGISELGGDYRSVMSKVELAPKKPRGGSRRGRFGGDRQSNLDLEV